MSFHHTLRQATHAAIAALVAGLGASSALADPTFVVRNQSGLGAAAKFYYLGYGQIGSSFMVLGPGGGWIKAGAPGSGWVAKGWNPSTMAFDGAGIVPCYALSDGKRVSIPKNIAGARVYFFQVNKGTKLFDRTCANTPSTSLKVQKGVFGNAVVPGYGGSAPFSYFSTANGGKLNGASLAQLTSGALPMWTFSEVGSDSIKATIDTSQVDFVGFPMNVTAKMIAARGSTTPVWNRGVGFSFSSASQVNMLDVVASYRAFVKALPASSKAGATTLAVRSNYAKLIHPTPGGTVLINPGNYTGVVDSKSFAGYFANIIDNHMWKPGWTGKIKLGSPYGNVPNATFSGTAVTLTNYPGHSGAIRAIRFTYKINGEELVAYVLSPTSYHQLCLAGKIAGCSAKTPAEQVFATDGALTTPTDGNQFLLLSAAQRAVWNGHYGGTGNYSQVVSRLGFIISMAYNHGVAGGLQTPGGLCAGQVLSACWSNQKLWYPNPAPGSNLSKLYFTGDTTQNLFSRWLHTATIKSVPMMTRPNNPVTISSGTMGMGYGFASDENPTPPNASYTQTPSKYDSIVSLTPPADCNYITIMPWTGTKANLSPVKSDKCR